MTNQITQAEFNGYLLPVIDHQDDAWITSESIGLALEYEFPREATNKIFERNKDEQR